MIMRRFSSKGDVDRAWEYVLQVGPVLTLLQIFTLRLWKYMLFCDKKYFRWRCFHLNYPLFLSQSDGVQQTNYLAQHYCREAIRQISMLRPSAERDALIRVTEMVLTRDKWTSPARIHFRQLPLGTQPGPTALSAHAGEGWTLKS